MTQALTSRDIRTVFHLLRQYAGASQTQIAIACGMSQGKVSETMKGGRQVTTLEVFERIADGLHMPDTARMTLGLAPRRRPSASAVTVPRPRSSTQTTPTQGTGPKADFYEAGELAGADDISRLTRWLTASDTTDETIEGLARSTSSLATAHTQVPAKRLLPQVLHLHRRTQGLLENGRSRPRHTRELLRINADLLAHAAVILGDVDMDAQAERYGTVALMLAREAGSNESYAWYAQAKTARWQNRLIEAADLSRQGFEASPRTPMKTQLAWYEANAAAIVGDKGRAREAVTRAEQFAEAVHDGTADLSVWSFPDERQALFALSVANRTGDPDAALRAATMADTAWANGAPVAPAIWAQIRVGTGVAHLLKGDLEGTADQLAELLTLDPGMRLTTVTRYLADLDRRLSHPRYRDVPLAVQLRQQIRDFNAAALTDDPDLESS
ncbi:helix-turn-helix domain-containing protein [Actinomadura madurae]|uniref:helix-turn-helix domain-containing protein n=1 Tax=Actinomadura madurae TaxID=1993 RepID=UPI0020260C69|nr:helix-turn-helix transcriptional regulator [Actinomadura madurae]URM97073.1 helix-turn-helix domain-containing protein [Actinomadura madurae]